MPDVVLLDNQFRQGVEVSMCLFVCVCPPVLLAARGRQCMPGVVPLDSHVRQVGAAGQPSRVGFACGVECISTSGVARLPNWAGVANEHICNPVGGQRGQSMHMLV
eukprot:1157408-Pelagomonas_calceolata.AAC.9